MITNPYKNIDPRVAFQMQTLIPNGDSYHKGHARRMARTIDVLLNAGPEGKVLEIGTSSLVPLVLDKVAPDLAVTVTHFDLSLPKEHAITLEMNGVSKEFPAYSVNIEEEPLPADDETFDVVLCCEVLEHMEVDPMYMLAEVNRVLKPGGLLVLTTPNAASTHSIFKILRGTEPYFYMQYRHDRSLYRHNYEYSIHSLTAVIAGAGFDPVIWTEDSFEDPYVHDVPKLRSMGYNISNFGDNLFCASRKISGVVDRHPAIIYAD